MKELGRIKERHEFSFDSRQLGLVLFAAVLVAALAFVLGITVGRQWELKKMAEAPPAAKPAAAAPVAPAAPPVATPPAPPVEAFAARTTAAPEEKSSNAETPLTFPKVLTSNTKKTAPLVPQKKPEGKAGVYTVQVGAYNEKKAALARAGRLKKKGYEARVYTAKDKKDKYAYKVRIGSFNSRDEASATAKKVESTERLTPYVTLE